MLHIAVKRGHLEIVLALLRCGHDINSFDRYDCTPLHVATKNKLNTMAYVLISIGADINIKDKTGHIPIFHRSAESGDLNTLQLFRGNARVNPILLRITVQLRDIKIVQAILERRSLSINTPDTYGQTALYFTAYRERVSMYSSENEIPFSDGVEADIAKMLLDKGSDVNFQTHKGVTTLHAAIENGYFKLVDTLLEHDADVNLKTEINETPLHVSVRKNFEAVSQRLLNKGANVNAKLTYFQITPLHIAAYKRNEKIAELLLQFGAKLDCKTIFDLTPLHIATIVGSLKVVQILLKFGADVDAKDKFGRTALHIACKEQYGSIITALLNHGADINIINPDDCTPFDYAKAGFAYSKTEIYDPDGKLCTLNNTYSILKRHVIKLRALNLFVTERISEFVDRDLDMEFVDRDLDMGDFRYECEEEIKDMKKEVIDNSVSFYDILTKNKLATYVRYEDIVRVLRSEEYKIKFPIYADMIKINLVEGKRRNSLLKQINPVVFGLPYNCFENILSYLDESELIILGKASKPTNDVANSSNMFETPDQYKMPEMAPSIKASINHFTQVKGQLSLKYFDRQSGPIYLSELFLMFAYFERVCLHECYCRNRKCYTLYHIY